MRGRIPARIFPEINISVLYRCSTMASLNSWLIAHGLEDNDKFPDLAFSKMGIATMQQSFGVRVFLLRTIESITEAI